MNNKVKMLLNEQIARELESGYLYLDLAAALDRMGLRGFAHWYQVQAEEEKDHAMKIYHYLLDEGEEVHFGSLDMPEHNTPELRDILMEALHHEEYVTELINNIYDAATDEGDYRTLRFLDWFIDEQREEEKNARDNLESLIPIARCGCGCGIMALDKRMEER